MAEVLVQFANPVIAEDGTAYQAQAVGARREDGMWEGWIEFIPLDGGQPLRSSRETTQPNRNGVAYWSTGLTPVYLEGALDRTRHPLVRKRVETPAPLFEGPAPRVVAVLDPFSAYEEKGETVLRKELGALSHRHLVNIIRAFQLTDEPETALTQLSEPALIEIIVSSVRSRLERL
jgi:hypothetical protein